MIAKIFNRTNRQTTIFARYFSNSASIERDKLKGLYHESQTAQLNDSLTLVDLDDNVIGSISKLDGHLKANLTNEKSLPHRAFSLLLFNSKNELLLQQRSMKKITFPGLWTNTCCSHNAHIPVELEEEPNYIGMRRAAVRRAEMELGIKDLTPEELHVGSRILYYAEACPTFAEFELDYIIFAKKDIQEHEVNRDEIMATQYVRMQDFDDFIEERKKKYGEDITPWFYLLKHHKLMNWWKTLIEHNQFPKEAHKIEKYI